MRRQVAAALLTAVTLTACQQTESKSLVERIYEHRLRRWGEMMPKDETSRCEVPAGTTYRDALKILHRVMTEQVTKDFPQRGICSKHGHAYLICNEKNLEGEPSSTIYRLDSAKDGSDSKMLLVWSQQ
jgi:hypothetical protein